METLKTIISDLQILSISFCALVMAISGITIMINSKDESIIKKHKSRIIHALVFMVLVIVIFQVKDLIVTYFGNDVGVGEIEAVDPVFAKITDKDCQGRETIRLDGKYYVVTDTDKYLSQIDNWNWNYGTLLESYLFQAKEISDMTGSKFDFIRPFDDCQGFTKGFYADVVYIRLTGTDKIWKVEEIPNLITNNNIGGNGGRRSGGGRRSLERK